MVCIPKGGGDYRNIGLVEVIWEAVAVILNCRFTAAITYHDSLHGLQVGCSTGTTTLEVKLLQKVAALRGGGSPCDIIGPAQGLRRLG